jgi:mono/diheme cytochrome c family protein
MILPDDALRAKPRISAKVTRNSRWRILAGMSALILCMAADGSWLRHVPETDRKRVNPYAGQPDAVAAGSRMFADHCAQCHGPDALGNSKHPSLRSDRVQNAKDGEIFWLLRNGNLSRGMPSWSALPEPSRWQIITYVKSLGPSTSSGPAPDSTPVPGPSGPSTSPSGDSR